MHVCIDRIIPTNSLSKNFIRKRMKSDDFFTRNNSHTGTRLSRDSLKIDLDTSLTSLDLLLLVLLNTLEVLVAAGGRTNVVNTDVNSLL